MQILRMEQNSEPWREFRRPRIGGTTSNSIHPSSRKSFYGDKDDITGTAAFWGLVAGNLSISKDAESEMERGHRLEPLGNKRTNELLGLDLVWATAEEPDMPGVWVSSISESIYVSPDASERGDKPTYANEVKAFDTPKHLFIIYTDRKARKEKGYNPMNSVPKENKGQAADYFAVNPNLKVLYWTLINDMVAYEELEHYVIEIHREDIEEEIETLQEHQSDALVEKDRIIKELLNG